jgi:exodeoxyribonuclease V alpha subunit
MRLRESSVVGKPGEYKPLVLDEIGRLYLYRYWNYEDKLANWIKSRVGEDERNIDFRRLKEGLARLFPEREADVINWQKVAAFTALTKPFCVISGGPGTGKTATVGKILALLLEKAGPRRPRIALAAPTGKAAARLQEAIKETRGTLNCPSSIKEAIPNEASTIHRLLGTIPDSPDFRYNPDNPLPFDTVVIDEASMGDLPLMSKLIQALPSEARLILLGDKDQLASVEAGAVLGDICDTGNVHCFSKRFADDLKRVTGYGITAEANGRNKGAIQDCVIELRKSYRFRSDSGIGAASRAVNAGDGDLAVTVMTTGRYGDIEWKGLPHPQALGKALRDLVVEGFESYLKAREVSEIFELFDRFRILCVVREGPCGVVALNALVERILRMERLIEPDQAWYRGRPVLITRNDYHLGLFNGDVGIVFPDSEAKGELRAFFPDTGGHLRKFHPLRLPEHETVYAMTVHKSQGSEFDRVVLLLPDRDSPVLTRELLYTALTRSRERVEVWGVERVFRAAVSRRIERTSGLRDALWRSRP